ncbi:aromatic-ring-hydroxylating dioxygenase subunit beta [Amycolatopsis acidicola]|uniref:Aromatic-ring-hydroxylating dioxygenase subunit beta n=1 Tax=Amycolatopsis acidicola TaxID=2596893 RepID=A0A5N0VCJ6_9PSEU|nr:aromatic-ring-hydroxylating dioxygenase subunit beta [Amycolatopsis acidicola]KAA9162611.1 aromatic-ring-hydroxylating dioxygenase subunit beta [Amycolatopsis acidicola]
MTITRDEAEAFLYAEARLADEHRYDEWEELWADEALYWVPAGPGSVADPESQISVIYDNRSRIGLRVAQLKTGKRHSQDPLSTVAHLVSNVEIEATEENGVRTRATFLAVESRIRGLTTWAGTVRHSLVRDGGKIRMSRKVVLLVNRDQPLPTMSFLI